MHAPTLRFERLDRHAVDHLSHVENIATLSQRTQTTNTVTANQLYNAPYGILAFNQRGPIVFAGHLAVVTLEDGEGILDGLIVNEKIVAKDDTPERRDRKISGTAVAIIEFMAVRAAIEVPGLRSLKARANRTTLPFYEKAQGVRIGKEVTRDSEYIVDLTRALRQSSEPRS